MNREQRAALLAVAEPAEVIELADACLEAAPPPKVLVAPEVGCVSVQVREPIVRDRFLLGDVLACRAEVELDGARGWAMRLGDDRAAALAAAILDAAVESGRARTEVDELCARVAERQRLAEDTEWAELAPTIVEFEEL
ncbi:phosphonate C-P lyase system protein PhnG [Saccharopolyspora shandongensis]|uniref:Alpha-D-ribose 1-methylphosphonate 5-triphosphate synthase subunit PhnG n=1 Tax=Saccharopolyspora shandongensis TaxID=418495 RepID=A0A1H2UZU5_9PSEU|nr:phosphonate C-P lyase system protein PhnG [Saccharopolyspora shandongensis]SDW61616.1 alpha-D-ribose 1-methylphosphonate 5-triphosphate synthase subunit PhnG [Saccharopolyspora shandongensis]